MSTAAPGYYARRPSRNHATGTEAMRVDLLRKPSQLILILGLVLITSGCRSSSRWASLNPWATSEQDTSLAARTAPELPSEQSDNPGGGTAAIASKNPAPNAEEAPPFVATTSPPAASSPYPTTTPVASASPYPSTSPYPNTATAGAAPAASVAATPAPKTATPAAGPYDPNSYQPPVEAVADSGDGRYGGSRYEPSGSLPFADMGPPSTVASQTGSSPSIPPLAELTASAQTSLPKSPAIPSPQMAVAKTQEVAIPATPGGYRPGGTTTYDPQISVAARTAPVSAPAYPATNPPTTSAPQSAAPAYPSTSGGMY